MGLSSGADLVAAVFQIYVFRVNTLLIVWTSVAQQHDFYVACLNKGTLRNAFFCLNGCAAAGMLSLKCTVPAVLAISNLVKFKVCPILKLRFFLKNNV